MNGAHVFTFEFGEGHDLSLFLNMQTTDRPKIKFRLNKLLPAYKTYDNQRRQRKQHYQRIYQCKHVTLVRYFYRCKWHVAYFNDTNKRYNPALFRSYIAFKKLRYLDIRLK